LIIIVGFAVIEAVMSKVWVKSAHGASYDPAVGTQLVEFSDATISDTSAMRKREWGWDAVRRVHDRRAGLVLELVGWDMIVLPARLWGDPKERQAFVEEIRGRITRPAGEPVSTTSAPAPAKLDLFILAAIGAFVDVCLVGTSFLPLVASRGAVAVVVLASAALGYGAYRLAKAQLPRLDARSPAAAAIVAHSLIWAFAVWFGATALGLI
jgi:hypothetical protein